MSTELDSLRTRFPVGLSLVEASAGTGKTFNLALGVVRMLLERDDDESPRVNGIAAILVVTFTTAATEELVSRIRRFVQVAYRLSCGETVDESATTVDTLRALVTEDPAWARQRLGQALSEMDGLAVFTIHGFCKRVLDEFALESGTLFHADLLQDESRLREAAVADWWRRTFYQDASFVLEQVSSGPEAYAMLVERAAAWPEAIVEPSGSMEAFRAMAYEVVQAFCTAWPTSDFRARASTVPWRKDAVYGHPDDLAETDDLVQAMTGCPPADVRITGQALQRIAEYAAPLLFDAVAKGSKVGKQAAAELAVLDIAVIGDQARGLLEALPAFLGADCLREVNAAITAAKAERQALGFNDLLAQLAGAIRRQGPDGLLATAVRRRYAAALIDEFQDTDDLQFEIFRSLFKARPLVLIGDPKQAIYAFRGADVHAYLRATKAVPDEQRFTLTTNYRSVPAVVEAVNRLFENRTHPLSDREIVFPRATTPRTSEPAHPPLTGAHGLEVVWLDPGINPKTGDPDWFSKGSARDQALTQCVSQILELLRGGWSPKQIAILVREGREGVAVEKLLRAHNVPAIVSGMGNVLESDELADVHMLLAAIAYPRRAGLVRAALGTTLWGFPASKLQALHEGREDAVWTAVLDQFASLLQTWQRHGVLRLLQEVMISQRVAERLLPLADGDRRLTNLRHVIELVHAAESAQHLGIDGVLRCLAGWRAAPSERDDTGADVTQLRLETDAEAVQIITVHRSKGLQYDIVFCPTLWNGRPVTEAPFFVDTVAGKVLDLGSAESAARMRIANAARLAEDLRLLYVALTRARFRTYVTWAPVVSGRGKDDTSLLANAGSVHSALGYLLCTDPSLDNCDYEDAPQASAERLIRSRAGWRDALRAMAADSAGVMAVTDAFLATPMERWEPDAPPAMALTARTLPVEPAAEERFRTFAIGSFTSLTRGKPAVGREEVPRDRDDDDGEPDSVSVSSLEESAVPRTIATLPPSDFRAFPAGPREGTLLHTLFEQSRFQDDPDALRPRVSALLQTARIATNDGDPRIDAVVEMMHRVFTTSWTLPGSGTEVRLCDVPQRSVRHEWQFLLPCAEPARPLTSTRLITCFRQADDRVARAYAPFLQSLPSASLNGYLQGFVDLLFEHDGRWHVVDWKSNRLPLDPRRYEAAALETVMHEKHYTLQAHLYVVALHRFLRTRIPDYDYDRHVGGFAYAYLRGFVPEASVTGHGWYTHRPSRLLIEALDTAIGRPSASFSRSI